MKDTSSPDAREGPLHRQAGGVSVWHPENLDVGALVESWGQRVAEGVLWLGRCVFVGLADDARCRDTGRVPLKADYLRNVLKWHEARRRATWQRIHTNLTNLAKSLRGFLTVDGERLVNVDISESQPLFMGMVIAKSNGQTEAAREGASRTEGSHPPSPSLMMDNTMVHPDLAYFVATHCHVRVSRHPR